MARTVKSALTQTMEECYLCQSTYCIEKHHIFNGSNKKHSEKYGFIVPLCLTCHNTSPNGVHFNAAKNNRLKREAQHVFERDHTREEFRLIFGKSYL